MATGQDQVNPASHPVGWGQVGRDVTFIKITSVGGAINAKLGPGGALEALVNCVQQYATIIHMAETFTGSNKAIDCICEGVLDSDIIGRMQADAQAMGTVDSVAMGSATIAAIAAGSAYTI